MPDHIHLKWWYQFEETIWSLYAGKKPTSSFKFSLRHCKDIILQDLGVCGYTHPKWYYQLVENFDVSLYDINKLYHSFLS